MKRQKVASIMRLTLGVMLLLLLHTSGIRLASKTYYCKLVTWPNNPTAWATSCYHDIIDVPAGSFESSIVFGVRTARWSWQFNIQNR